MNLPFFFARRYLFAKKSHNVINIISAISAVGIAIGTAALVIVLSIYNGFDALIK
ncbi:MAG TPA: ABC transporter permease, partial [Candidatus Cryptobacteroides intestinipullorum]|nr:ABC transporter permease [Candidatus Cryptobacteroides intestinipullorum]